MKWYQAYLRLRCAALNAMTGGRISSHKWLILSELQAIQTDFTGDPAVTVDLNLPQWVFKRGPKRRQNDRI